MGAGVGVDKPNPWAFDTTQFDNILKKLKVVMAVSVFVFFLANLFEELEMIFHPFFLYVCCLQQAAPITSRNDDGNKLLLVNYRYDS